MFEEHRTIRRFEAGDVIFHEGDPGDTMFVVRAGSVETIGEQRGKEVRFATIKSKDFFGEMALFAKGIRSATARALEPTELIEISEDELRAVVQEPLVWRFLSTMSDRLRGVDERLAKASAEDQIRKDHLASIIEFRRRYG